MTRASILVQHWRRLNGTVHPDDKSLFEEHDHSFNLDFPPPAYLGDIDNAPLVLLMMNGGYNASDTPAEFATKGAVESYLDRLWHPRPVEPTTLAPYYLRTKYAKHLMSGRLALVNAVAYRSGSLSKEPQNKRLARRLPSTELHLRWLRTALIPQAIAGDRTIIAHRNGMWNLKRYEFSQPNVIFTPFGGSPSLPTRVTDLIEAGKVQQSPERRS